jgi:hypothetical protein
MKRERGDSGNKSKTGAAAGRKPKTTKAAPPARAARLKPPAAKPPATAKPPANAKPAAAAKPAPPKTAAVKPATAKPAAAKPTAEKPAAKPSAPPRAKKAAPARTAPSRPQKAAPAAKAPKSAKPAPAEAPPTPTAPAKAATPRAPRAPRAARPVAVSVKAEADFTDEERVESAKYQTGERAPRVFEEERFIFPETYGHNRLRLLVKDPQWLFAHWDVDPGVFAGLRGEMGERAAALSRLTLKVEDPEHGGGAVIHLPEDARSWYVRADGVRRAYRAELGLTLPSGEYRPLATSNTVRTPAGSASPRRASRRARYEGPRRPLPVEPTGEWPRAESAVPPPGVAAAESARRTGAAPGPWQPRLVEPRPGQPAPEDGVGDGPEKGGASDAHRPLKPGAGDLQRR